MERGRKIGRKRGRKEGRKEGREEGGRSTANNSMSRLYLVCVIDEKRKCVILLALKEGRG